MLHLRQNTPYVRHLEILAYLRKHDLEDVDWIALDDQPDLFPPGLSNLIVCDPEKGFQGLSVDE